MSSFFSRIRLLDLFGRAGVQRKGAFQFCDLLFRLGETRARLHGLFHKIFALGHLFHDGGGFPLCRGRCGRRLRSGGFSGLRGGPGLLDKGDPAQTEINPVADDTAVPVGISRRTRRNASSEARYSFKASS